MHESLEYIFRLLSDLGEVWSKMRDVPNVQMSNDVSDVYRLPPIDCFESFLQESNDFIIHCQPSLNAAILLACVILCNNLASIVKQSRNVTPFMQ